MTSLGLAVVDHELDLSGSARECPCRLGLSCCQGVFGVGLGAV